MSAPCPPDRRRIGQLSIKRRPVGHLPVAPRARGAGTAILLAAAGYATGAAADALLIAPAPSPARWRAWETPDWTLDSLATSSLVRADAAAQSAAASIRGRGYPRETLEGVPVGSAAIDLDPSVTADVKATYALLAASPLAAPSHFHWSVLVRASPSHMQVQGFGAEAAVDSAIAAASAATRVSPHYLWNTAYRESGLKPFAATSSSSATGLFQFIRSTWLSGLKRYGPALGLSRAAAAITIDPKGRPYAHNMADEADLLALRSDPLASSAIAGALTKENAARLHILLGRSPTEGQLYVAHVLGPEGAILLERAAETAPFSPAAELFPAAAKANPALFYAAGRSRSVLSMRAELLARGTG